MFYSSHQMSIDRTAFAAINLTALLSPKGFAAYCFVPEWRCLLMVPREGEKGEGKSLNLLPLPKVPSH